MTALHYTVLFLLACIALLVVACVALAERADARRRIPVAGRDVAALPVCVAIPTYVRRTWRT